MNINFKLFLSMILCSISVLYSMEESRASIELIPLEIIHYICKQEVERCANNVKSSEAIKEFKLFMFPASLICTRFAIFRNPLTTLFITRTAPAICNALFQAASEKVNVFAPGSYEAIMSPKPINIAFQKYLELKPRYANNRIIDKEMTTTFQQFYVSKLVDDYVEISKKLGSDDRLFTTDFSTLQSFHKINSESDLQIIPERLLTAWVLILLPLSTRNSDNIKIILAVSETCKCLNSLKKQLLEHMRTKEIVSLTFWSAVTKPANENLITFLLNIDPSIINYKGGLKVENALMLALLYKQNNIAKFLIEKGIDINAKGVSGATALMYALRNNLGEIAMILLGKDSDIHCTNDLGENALIYAIIYQNEDIAKILIDKGIKVDSKNRDGISADELAESFNQKGIARLLREKKALLN